MTLPTSEILADVMVSAMRGQTDAGDNVFGYRDWPTAPDIMPIILLDLPDEDMESLGNGGAPQFLVTATVPIVVRVSAPADAGDTAAGLVQSQLADYRVKIKKILINRPTLWNAGLQRFPFIRSKIKSSSDGKLTTGELQMQIGIEFYQGPEQFYDPIAGDELIAGAPALTDVQVTTDITQGDSLVIGPRLDIQLPQ
ncbi:MAG: hypothetical protein ACXU82_03855 [Caulobacteraceae bacterium]